MSNKNKYKNIYNLKIFIQINIIYIWCIFEGIHVHYSGEVSTINTQTPSAVSSSETGDYLYHEYGLLYKY